MTIERFRDAPTVEAVMEIGCDRQTAEKVVAVLDGSLSSYEASAKCAKWVDACYHKPDLAGHEAKLEACADLLGMHEVVSLDIEGADYHTDEGIRFCPPFSYANAGDTYATTLFRDHEDGSWVISCWGDLAEEYEKEHKIGDFEEFEEKPDQCPNCHGAEFTLESYPRGEHTDKGWVVSGIGHYYECNKCGHHCQTPEDFTPPVHLMRTRGDGSQCGDAGQVDPDIEKVTCETCIEQHDEIVGETE